MANPDLMKHKNIIDVVKYRPLWLFISAVLLIPCIIAIAYLMWTQPNHAPVKLGIDYTGGTILQYSTANDVSIDDIENIREQLTDAGFQTPVAQLIKNQNAAVFFEVNNENPKKIILI